jgi:DNA-binding NtrC family response regulator
MMRVRIGVEQLSHRSRTAVLLMGDVGTGRRHCALALHTATYPEGEFFEFKHDADLTELARRVAALRAHAASAPGLTIYLPEIAKSALDVQRYLLDLLRLSVVPCRLVGTSRARLAKSEPESKLRPDLAAAFSSQLTLPPLSARRTDIAPLAVHFAEQFATRAGAPPLSFSMAAIDALQSYSWPGNVAELADLIGRLWREHGSGVVEIEDLPELGEHSALTAFRLPPDGIVFADLEKAMLTQALAMAANNKSRAASLLGMTRDQLRYRMEKFDISSDGAQGGSTRRKR